MSRLGVVVDVVAAPAEGEAEGPAWGQRRGRVRGLVVWRGRKRCKEGMNESPSDSIEKFGINLLQSLAMV